MPKQTIYIDNYAVGGNSDIVTSNAQTIRININGMLNDLPPYANISLKQLEFISGTDLASGLVMVYKGTASNQMNIGKGDPIMAICPFDHTKGSLYHYKAPEIGFPLMIAGNIQQIEFGFKNVNNIAVSLVGKLYGIVLEIETPDVGEPVASYRKAIPL
tara:strand:+ start:456 stop:932 length:477 start_codon:yes stop_codon:yes gene_type:complete